MDCQARREDLIDYLYGELAPEAWLRVERHLQECGGCREELAALQRVAAALDQWRVPAPPPGLVERTVAGMRAAAAESPAGHGPRGLAPATALLALGLGGLAAAVSLGLTAHLTPHQGAPLTLAAVGIVWAVLYGGLFVVVLGRWARLQDLARVALLAGGLAVLFTPVLSIPEVVEACRAWLGAARGSLALNALLFAVGGLYTAAPLLVAHVATGRQPGRPSPSLGLASGLGYLLLVAPVFYLQCAALAMGVGATWMAGGIVGVLAGGPAGVWLAGRRAVVRA
jgi:anti-sigma factor RsiW